MKVPRRLSLAAQFILDELVPPIIRDSKWFMYLPMKLVLKDATGDFLTFKDSAFAMTSEQFENLYERTAHVQELQGETDLTEACTEEILRELAGSILEVGCGRGYLTGAMSAKGHHVTACDLLVSDSVRQKNPNVSFIQAKAEALPFADHSFDTVVSTHTLEHVQNLSQAISELRRVGSRKVIVVVPRQRSYKFTFSLHTQFFPYPWSIEGAFGSRKGATLKRLGDWLYIEPLDEA